jgi:hypothetical protein
MVFPSWPWTNLHNDNQDWLIETVKKCEKTVADALTNVSDAVAMYFADHLDTSLTQSGEAADAAAVGNRLGTLSNNISSVQASIPELDVTLSSAQAAAPAATVGNRLANIQDDITNLQTYVSTKTFNIEFNITPNQQSASLTPLSGTDALGTFEQFRSDLAAGRCAGINVHKFNNNTSGDERYDVAYGIYLEVFNQRILFETHDYTFVMVKTASNVVVTYTAK